MLRWLPVVGRILFFLVIGVILFYAPWSGLWDHNFFLSHYPWIFTVARNDFVRGAISGVGLADIWLATAEFRRITPEHPGASRPLR